MQLGTKVGLGPDDIVLVGDPAPPPERGTADPHFLARVYCGQTARWIEIPLGTEVLGFGPGDIDLDGNPGPPRKGAQQPLPHISAHFTVTRSPISAAAEHLHMLRYGRPMK